MSDEQLARRIQALSDQWDGLARDCSNPTQPYNDGWIDAMTRCAYELQRLLDPVDDPLVATAAGLRRASTVSPQVGAEYPPHDIGTAVFCAACKRDAAPSPGPSSLSLGAPFGLLGDVQGQQK